MRMGLLIPAVLAVLGAVAAADDTPKATSPGVLIQQDDLSRLQAELAETISALPTKVMRKTGLAGAMGETRVRVTSAVPQEVILPIPQITEGQVPLCFLIGSTPADAVADFRLREREGGNVVVVVRIVGKKQDVQVKWSAVVLLSEHDVTPNRALAKPYQASTSCVQAEADAIKRVAADIWPASGKADEFAASIQKHIGGMKRVAQPRSLDAVGIINSGENGICTANANLASALMRSRGIACRSVAVIPPISQRLEMHRVAEFHDQKGWVRFDPSSLQTDIPARPWHNVVLAKTTIPDEAAAMKPRMGVMLGCPYGQELEMVTPGLIFVGQDFFWTIAKPMTEFEVSEDAARLAAEAWGRYLQKGTLTPSQLKASSAKTSPELVELLKSE